MSHGVKKLAVLSLVLWRGGERVGRQIWYPSPIAKGILTGYEFWSYSALTPVVELAHQAVLAERHLAHVI